MIGNELRPVAPKEGNLENSRNYDTFDQLYATIVIGMHVSHHVVGRETLKSLTDQLETIRLGKRLKPMELANNDPKLGQVVDGRPVVF